MTIVGNIWISVCESLEESAPWVFSNKDLTLLYDVLVFPVQHLCTENGWVINNNISETIFCPCIFYLG